MNERVAVIGSGAAGLTAAYLLQDRFRVVLYEKDARLGGHTYTVDVDRADGSPLPIDMGFIVMNHRHYPLLTRLFKRLGVELEDSDMSFSYVDRNTNLQYRGSGLNGLFAQRRNLFRPSFYLMIRQILRFFKTARADLEAGRCSGKTLAAYLNESHYSRTFIQHHILPMGAAIWSTPADRMMEFPAETFIRFFSNHALLDLKDRPLWRTVTGGSQTYVRTIKETFKGLIRSGTPVVQVEQHSDGVEVRDGTGAAEQFDYAILACHGDQSGAVFSNPDPMVGDALTKWNYHPNHTVLHTDAAQMPPLRSVWSSWNYIRESGAHRDHMVLTYYMNRLQNLPGEQDYFVSLNAPEMKPESVKHEVAFEHPVYSQSAMDARGALTEWRPGQRVFFAGSYLGYGFHEDAVRSAVRIAEHWGIAL